MDRRILLLIGAGFGCGRKAPPPLADASAFAFPLPEVDPIDAAPEPDAEPIESGDVLSGAAAEQVIGAGKTLAAPGEKRDEPPAPVVGPAFLITSDAVGPFHLGAPRAEVVKHLQGRAFLQRLAGAPGEPSAEAALLPGGAGRPLLRLRVYAGRLQEIQVLARDKRAVTDTGLGVGVPFSEVLGTYGEARLVREPRTGRRLGFVLQDLPGVLFVPALPAALAAETPPPTARVARILVVGAEETAED